jgi:peptidoglycan hydrolase CwlO-like protein
MSTIITSTLDNFQSYIEELSMEKLQISVKLKFARAKIEELEHLLEKKDQEIGRLKRAIESL